MKIGWVDDGDNQGHYDLWNVEILHKNNENQWDHNVIFKNNALMKVRNKITLMLKEFIH